MIVQKKDIVHELEKVKPGLASKEMIEQSTINKRCKFNRKNKKH